MSHRVSHIEIPSDDKCIKPALGFIDTFAEGMGIEAERRLQLRAVSEAALEAVIQNNREAAQSETIGIEVFEKQGSLHVEVHNRGVPIFLDGKDAKFQAAARTLDKLSLENLGRNGQTLSMAIRLGEAAAKTAMEGLGGSGLGAFSDSDVVIREMRSGEEAELSKLFYFVYGYDYINDFVYYPEKIRQMLEEKKLIGIVAALPNGRLLGHVGLLKWSDNPSVYEPCLGVVDPRVKSRGLFGQIFQRMMDRANEISMQYLFFDFVTNHDHTQRFVSRYGTADLAIFVGCQSKKTQASLERLGLGADPIEMDRYSLLYSIIPKVKHPFGKVISLPNNLGDLLGFLLKPLNLTWHPTPRFQLLAPSGEYETHLQPNQNAVVFSLFKAGRAAVDRILTEWHGLLRSGYQYGAVEVPVSECGLGNLYDILAANGFFISGFVPYKNSDVLALRFQSIGPTKVAFDQIKVSTDTAKRLLAIAKESYERNGIL